MNVSSSYASEAQFGPPSEPISIQEFLQTVARSKIIDNESRSQPSHWSSLSHERQQELAAECRVDLLKSTVENVMEDPFKYAYILRMHEDNVDAIYTSSKPGGQMKQKTRKRKRADVLAPEDVRLTPDVQELRDSLDSIQLKSWLYSVEAAAFIRPQKNSDLNVLTKVRVSKSHEPTESPQLPSASETVITISVYNRLSWGSTLSRSSQHAVLSSETIGEFLETIPCPSNEIPADDTDADRMSVGHFSEDTPPQRGSVVCIEGIAYGDGFCERDYAVKLDEQMQRLPQKKRRPIQRGPSMHDVRFVDVTLRINQPYWLLHQGSCEHFLVVDQIRFRHPSDPPTGFPITLHITPPIVDLCQACARVPASVAIVGDIRLGQSPCKLCGPCWRSMGGPKEIAKEDENITVVPMPKHDLGWY